MGDKVRWGGGVEGVQQESEVSELKSNNRVPRSLTINSCCLEREIGEQ